MVRIKVSVLDKGFSRRQATIIRDLSERHIEAIARETERVIKKKISERIKRAGSTGNLANSFFTVKISGGWGVGDINFLNQQAPYWYWQNFGVAQSGRRIPPGTNENSRIRGHFEPDTNGRFKKGSPSFPMNPTKAIEAKNYIQATLNEVNQIVSGVVRRIKL